jgi:hypothetical protein
MKILSFNIKKNSYYILIASSWIYIVTDFIHWCCIILKEDACKYCYYKALVERFPGPTAYSLFKKCLTKKIKIYNKNVLAFMSRDFWTLLYSGGNCSAAYFVTSSSSTSANTGNIVKIVEYPSNRLPLNIATLEKCTSIV